jgi:AraC-like DNA-binding protein
VPDHDIQLRIPETLRPWVLDAQTPRAAPAPLPNVRIPDAATSLVFRTDAAGRSDLVVIGPQTRAGYYAGKDVPTCVRLRLRPGRARPLLDVTPRDLVDRTANLADLWGGPATTLVRRLERAGGEPELIVAWLGAALLARVPEQSRLDRSELAVSATMAVAAQRRLDSVAREVAVSERHLRTLFETEVGVSPKHFARIQRLRRVLAATGRQPVNGAGPHAGPGATFSGGGWAGVARDAGFYDQAHLTTDFRAMMGVPPGAFADGRLPPTVACAAR